MKELSQGAIFVRSGLKTIPCMLMILSCLTPCAQAQQGNATSNTASTSKESPASLPAPIPPDSDLQNPNNTLLAPQLAPVPVLEPARTPQDQARINAEKMQAIAAQQAAQPIQPQLTPVTAPQAMPLQAITPQAVPQQASTENMAPAAVTKSAETTPAKTSEANTPQQPAAEQAQEQAQPSHTSGFAPQNAGGSLPLNQGQMPLSAPMAGMAGMPASMPPSNAGMNMNIDPNLVGGTGLDANGLPVVPYEVQLEQRTREIQTKTREMAYEQAKRSVLPLETTEIKEVLGRLKDTQEAIQSPVRPAPKPDNVIETISTDPSATPKTIQLAAGNVTTLNIVDVTGAPWPIVDLGFGGAFDIKPPEAGGHVIRITPLKDFARGNLVVRLLKMTTPITFSLQAGGDTVNYRFDARIPDYGPNAKMPILDNGINAVAGDKTTTAFLEGVPPKGSQKLQVAGIDGRTSAYKYGGALYVRTPLSLISPAWQGSATSADGMNVFVLTDSPVLLLSDNGSLVRARISEATKDATGF